MKALIQRKLKEVDAWLGVPHEQVDWGTYADECLDILSEVERVAIRDGFPKIVALAQKRGGVKQTKRVLAACLATFTPETLTPPEVARRLKKSPDYVRDCIRRGQLKASNLGKGRPRWVVTLSDLAAFLKGKQPVTPVKRKRRRINVGLYKRYSA